MGTAIIEHMFDGSLAAPADLVGVSDAALIGAIAGWARASAAAEARKLAAIAERNAAACRTCASWGVMTLDCERPAAAAEIDDIRAMAGANPTGNNKCYCVYTAICALAHGQVVGAL